VIVFSSSASAALTHRRSPLTMKSASRAPHSVQRNSLGGNFGRGPVVATPAPNNGPEIGGERLA
jgi:hypothetical protein